MALPQDFLDSLAKEKYLSPKETEVLLALFGSKKSRIEVIQSLNISDSAFGTRLSGVYKKFNISGSGPVKFNRLQDYLANRYSQQISSDSNKLGNKSPTEQIIDLVQEVRQRVYSNIQEQCSSMRVLDMEQPIALSNIYTHVNVLEKVIGRRRLGLAELLERYNFNEFERPNLNFVQEHKIPALEAVGRYGKLIILGKPGAGKTTFLKQLAVQCNLGQIQSDRIPVFITLKTFAEAKAQPSLLEYIEAQWLSCGIDAQTAAESLFEHGNVMVLLDGLDEIKETDHDRVLEEIRGFATRFHLCQFVMSCRIAAREYTFQQFTEVEVADFDEVQITNFVTKWFEAQDDFVKAERFLQKLEENKPIEELAANPLLLTLLCLVFQDSADFPTNRAELYKEGLDVLLKKWDAKRNIERDQIYKKLSLQRKEDLLSQIAFSTFERSEYFFKQSIVEQFITDYIQNFTGANTDLNALQLDSEAVLKSIEAQHGLLVERARGIYSFSHLTFHEYFTAKKIVSSSPAKALELQQNLLNHFTEHRWREVILLTISMVQDADHLVKEIKQRVDSLIADDATLQMLLVWANQKAEIASNRLLAATRAFYLTITLAVLLVPLHASAGKAVKMRNSGGIALQLEGTLTLTLARALHLVIDRRQDLELLLDYFLAYTVVVGQILAFSPEYDDTYVSALCDVLIDRFDSAIDCAQDCQFKEALEKFKAEAIAQKENSVCRGWWKTRGLNWVAQLKTAISTCRGLKFDWNLTEIQLELLQQYYHANKLLVDCINSDCYITRVIREDVRETLLLPISIGKEN